MKNISKIAGVAAVALALTQSVQAVPIVGSIGFSGNVTWDTSSAGTATQVTSWSATQVLSDSGSFASIIPIAPATFNNSVIWNLNDPSTAIANFWQAGSFSFTLNSSFIMAQGGTPGVNGFVIVDGTGIVHDGNPLDDTVMNWSFSAQDPKTASNPDLWTFSASTTSTVPDGGSTVMLLGIALSGAALLRRKLMA